MIVLLMLIIQTKDEPSLHETNCIQYYNTKFTNRWKEFESQGHPFHVLRDLSMGFGKNCCNSHATGSDVTSIFFHLPFVYHFHLQQKKTSICSNRETEMRRIVDLLIKIKEDILRRSKSQRIIFVLAEDNSRLSNR